MELPWQPLTGPLHKKPVLGEEVAEKYSYKGDLAKIGTSLCVSKNVFNFMVLGFLFNST